MASALLEYLQAARQQETNRLTCQQLLNELDERMVEAREEHEENIAEYPAEPVKGKTDKTSPFPEREPRAPRNLRIGSIFGYGILAALGFYIIIYTYFTYTTEEYEVSTQSMLIALVLGLLFGVVLYLLRRGRYNRKWERYSELHDAWLQRKNDYENRAYEQAMREYRNACDRVREENQANDAEYAAVVARYQAARCTIQAEIKEIEHTLEQLYAIGIIHEKYYKQGLVPITMFCEYFDTGICTQLEGPDGAYKTYEQQQLANRIIDQLDRIWSSVESIRANQYYLYRSINEVHHTVDRLSASVDNQTTLQSYHTRLLADKADAMRSIEQDKLRELRALRKAIDN